MMCRHYRSESSTYVPKDDSSRPLVYMVFTTFYLSKKSPPTPGSNQSKKYRPHVSHIRTCPFHTSLFVAKRKAKRILTAVNILLKLLDTFTEAYTHDVNPRTHCSGCPTRQNRLHIKDVRGWMDGLPPGTLESLK
eukprot:scaffold197433_cov43-Prasinocladus_malaysianus.AAC.1